MNKPSKTIPAVAIRGIATGLFMMTFFTGLWAGIAFSGLQDSPLRFLLVFFIACMILFVIQGIRFLGFAKKYPAIQTAEDAAEGKKMGKWFGIIFGAEGLFIFLGINLVTNLGHPDLIIPVIALVVGLHFYPMAWIFKRTIDFYLATWATLIAVCGIFFTLHKTLSSQGIRVFVGAGLALATAAYGIYMIFYGYGLMRENPVSLHAEVI